MNTETWLNTLIGKLRKTDKVRNARWEYEKVKGREYPFIVFVYVYLENHLGLRTAISTRSIEITSSQEELMNYTYDFVIQKMREAGV